MRQLVGHSGPVYSTSFSPDNTLLLSASEDGTGKFVAHYAQLLYNGKIFEWVVYFRGWVTFNIRSILTKINMLILVLPAMYGIISPLSS